jgi:hypothetical protein
MAIYTDFFLATQSELQQAMPLRVPPKDKTEKDASTPAWQWEPMNPYSPEALAMEFPTEKESKAVEEFDVISLKNVTPDILEQLHQILGGEADEFNEAISRPPLMAPGEYPYGGLFQVPPPFVTILAELPEKRLAATTEEWLGDKKAKPALVALRKMAKTAIELEKKMYLWMVV